MPLLEYVRECGEQLAEIITGRSSALEMLFTGGSYERAEALYERSPMSAYIAGIARAAVDAAIRSGAPGRRWSILEVGAGTGATASYVLPVIPANGSK
jgi:epothilone polyketide synthase E